MQEEKKPYKTEASGDLEAQMQKVSLIVSLVGLGLMLAGFVDLLSNHATFALPGDPVLPLPGFVHVSQVQVSLVAMSAGIVLLALLPAVRVLLALWFYLRRHSVLNTLVALIVFVELLLSMRTGG